MLYFDVLFGGLLSLLFVTNSLILSKYCLRAVFRARKKAPVHIGQELSLEQG